MDRKLLLILCALGLTAGCTLETECKVGQTRCVNNEDAQGGLQYCLGGFWGDPMTFANSCNADGTMLGSCLNGEVSCKKGKETHCEDGAESRVSCKERGCRLDELTCNECMDSEVVCKKDAIRACVNGSFELVDECEFGCNSEKTDCLLCVDDAFQCVDTITVQKCIENKWETYPPCPEGTICSKGQCVTECEEDEILCTDGTIMICSEGAWKIKSECDTHQCKNNQECTECIDGEESCTNDTNKVGTYKQCTSGRNLEFRCKNSQEQAVSCNNKHCGGCLNGSRKCENDTVYVCENGVWAESEVCPLGCVLGGNSCNSDGECKEGAFRCQDGKVQVCNAGSWGAENPCEFGCDVFGENCARESLSTDCSSSERKCVSDALYACVDDEWSEQEICEYGCKDGACVTAPECTNGDISCEDGFYQKCVDEHWGQPMACADNASCASESACGVCKNDETACFDGGMHRCESGDWLFEYDCDYDCNQAGTECISNPLECDNGDYRCIEDREGDYRQVCKDGAWTFKEYCVNASCSGDKCGICMTGNVRCNNGRMEMCEDATTWVPGERCEYGCNDTRTACLTTPPECTKSSPATCSNEDGIGILHYCKNGSWVDESCLKRSCNSAGNACGVCINGAEGNCIGGGKQVCSHGEWRTEMCQFGCNYEGRVCIGHVPTCSEGAIRCQNTTDENKEKAGIGKVQQCQNGSWAEIDDCKTTSCDVNKCGVCKNGVSKGECTGGLKQVCLNGKWTDEMCQFGCNYNNTNCIPHAPSCPEGSRKCENSNGIGETFECRNGDWGSTGSCNSVSCDDKECGVCKNGMDKGVCTNGAKQTCSSGKWGNSSCQYGCNFDGTACISQIPKCSEGSRKCENNSSKIGEISECRNGNWVPVSNCGSNSCTGDDCGVCKNGLDKGVCTGGAKQTCSNGNWGSSSCQYGCNYNGTACVSQIPKCSEGKQKCENNSSGIGEISECRNGDWVSISNCGSNSCSGDACGVCKNGMDKGVCSNGAKQTCSSGKWGSSSCQYGCNYNGTACVSIVPKCSEGKQKCDNNSSGIGQLYECRNGDWVSTSSCGSNSCDGSACGVCKNGSDKGVCSNGAKQTCSSGKWGSTSCQYGCNYKGTGCVSRVPGCSEGNYQCVNSSNIGQVQQCQDGAWVTTKNCGSYSCSGSSCGVCKNGADKGVCTGGAKQTCSNGQWSSTSCQYGCNYKGTGCVSRVPGCSEGKYQCVNNSSNIGQVQQCQDGAWVTTSSCGTKSCSGSSCGTCKNNATKCEGGRKYTCSGGSWGTGTSCTYGCNSAGTGCGSQPTACTNGSKKCESGKSYTCSGGSWGTGTSCSYGCCKSGGSCRGYGSDPC